MHIADGILPVEVVAGGAVASVALLALTVPRLSDAQAPKTAVMTAALFVGSLLAIPIPPTSVHLTLIGLAGALLGWSAFPAVAIAVALQTALLHHGGITTLGVNVATMGTGALVAGGVFRLRGAGVHPGRDARWAAFAALCGISVSLALYAGALLSAGEALRGVAYVAFGAHAPVVFLEAMVAGSAVAFVAKVRPRILGARAAERPAAAARSEVTEPVA